MPPPFSLRGVILAAMIVVTTIKLFSLNRGATPLSMVSPARQLVNATFVTLARNTDVWTVASSIQQVEDRFNGQYHYDWVFLNDEPFDETFISVASSLASGRTFFGQVGDDHWLLPDHIDVDKVQDVLDNTDSALSTAPSEGRHTAYPYANSLSYRRMCRYMSGFIFRHPLMQGYDYYWRVEPEIEILCNVQEDPFRYMEDRSLKYGFVMSLQEFPRTVPSLWESVQSFRGEYPEHIEHDNLEDFISDDSGQTYNLCHFWTNFEIVDLRWLRSKAYSDFFKLLDQDAGFFYERWGDAPIRSIAASLLLKKDEVHFFDNIGYYHPKRSHCPTNRELYLDLKCHCDPEQSFDLHEHSCLARYFAAKGEDFLS